VHWDAELGLPLPDELRERWVQRAWRERPGEVPEQPAWQRPVQRGEPGVHWDAELGLPLPDELRERWVQRAWRERLGGAPEQPV
jgi:hypothetical protein